MSKLKVDEIRSADRSVSDSANIFLHDSGHIGVGSTTPNLMGVNSNLGVTLSAGTSGNVSPYYEIQGSRTSNNARFGGIMGFHQANRVAGILFNRADNDAHGQIEFETEGGSGATVRMTIDQDGKVGIGTKTPAMPLHVSSAENNLMHLQSTDQDALFKLSDNGGHFQINTANNNTSLGTNGRGEMMRFTGTSGIVFNEDGLNQGFRVESDNNTEALTMDGANGIWGIGTTYGTYALKIDGVGNSGLFTGGVVSCGSLDNRSDERLKENIAPLGDSLNTLNQLRPVTFNLTKDVFAGEDFAGFIAQEVKTVFPVAVRGNENETEDVLNEDGEVTGQKPVYMSIKMMEMIALLTKSIQELSAKVTALENK